MKRIIIIILVIVVVLSSGIYAVYNNYQLGQELYREAQKTSILTHNLADGIGYLLEGVENPDRVFSTIGFDSYCTEMHLRFGPPYLPVREDVALEWRARTEALWEKCVNKDTEAIKQMVLAEKEELTDLKEDLYHFAYCMIDFFERYNKLSFWERCFTAWEKERDALSEQVKFS